jgi:hypothetical protein
VKRALVAVVLVALPGALAMGMTLAACRSGAPPVAPIEVVVVDETDASVPIAIAPRSSRTKDRCNGALLADTIETHASCFLDERISRGPGALVLPCGGSDGPAEATFAEQRYVGSVTGGVLTLDLQTELDWEEDHCHWVTKQAIHGDVESGALDWTYSERAIGQNCAQPCKAKATMRLER